MIASAIVLLLMFQGCSNETSPKPDSQREEVIQPVEAMKKSDCFSCHFVEEPSYGPAYLRIAERYKTREVKIRDLSKKVQTGGSGLWGGAQMSRHPFLKDRELDAMVSWVLSLSEREAALNTTYEKMPPMEVHVAGDGLDINVYLDEEGLYPQDSTRLFLKEARLSGRINQYGVEASHMSRDNSFPVVVVADGELNVESTGKYFFRLNGKKVGCLYIDGIQVISILESDQEALVELKSGKHEIRIETMLRHPAEHVVLEWIAPGNEYYSIVPADRFSS